MFFYHVFLLNSTKTFVIAENIYHQVTSARSVLCCLKQTYCFVLTIKEEPSKQRAVGKTTSV